jgi:hypothetical protein
MKVCFPMNTLQDETFDDIEFAKEVVRVIETRGRRQWYGSHLITLLLLFIFSQMDSKEHSSNECSLLPES